MVKGKTKKQLTAKEVAHMLGIPMVKVQRWVHQGKIPCKYKKSIGQEYYFKYSEITEWAHEHNFAITEPETDGDSADNDVASTSLTGAIKRGGVFYNLPGEDIFSVLKNGIEKIEFPVPVDKEMILDEIVYRESISSTGIGKGVAIPHLKDVNHLELPYPLIPVFFLNQPVDFDSIDGKPVFVLFFIFAPSPEFHLKMLSRLSYCLHNKSFSASLKNGVDAVQLLEQIDALESKIDID